MIGNWLAVFALILSYLSVYISPESVGVLPFAGLFYPIFVIINLVFIIFWVIRKNKIAFLSVAALFVGINHLVSFFQPRIAPENEIEDTSFQIISYNVRMFDRYNWSKIDNAGSKIVTHIASKNADIVCIQEFYSPKTGFDDYLEKFDSPYYHIAPIYEQGKIYLAGLATFSKFPIINRQEINFEDDKVFSVFSDIVVGKDTIRLFNSHLKSVHLGYNDYAFIDSIETKTKNERVRGIVQILKKLKAAYLSRAKQAEIIASNIKQSPYDVIVCGDFNDTPVSYVYHAIRTTLSDAFIESGSGFGNTFTGFFFSFFRIDFILHSHRLRSTNFKTEHIKFSDHYPISCRIRCKSKN